MAPPSLTYSVVIISWNQKTLLQGLVKQLLEQQFDPSRYEIVVVDDGSTDGSREWLRSLASPRVKVFLGQTDQGRAASRNRGIMSASGDIVVMIDGDHAVQPDLLSVLDERHSSARCVIVGKSDFADHPENHALNAYLNAGGAAKLAANTRLPGRYFLTRTCSVPRDLLLEVGMFGEGFRAWGGEDLDLGVRLAATGCPIYGEPRAHTVHHHHRALNDLLKQMRVYGRESIPILLERHPQLFSELNLDKVFVAIGDRRAGNARATLLRFLLTAPVYLLVRSVANRLRRQSLPREILDYLHFRQYMYGYLDYLKISERKS